MSCRTSKVGTSTAFTLVELLVVLGVITLIVALLMPALGKVRRQALEVKCAANLRSVGQALVMYVQQSGFYPGCYSDRAPIPAIWPTRLRGFTGGEKGVFDCPAQDERFHWGGATGETVPLPADEVDAAWFGYEVGEPLLQSLGSYFTYGYNLAGTGGASGERGLGDYVSTYPMERARGFAAEMPAARVKRPAEMIAIGDNTPDGIWDCMLIGGFPTAQKGWPGTIHRGGANILFCDGHVTWYPQNELVDFSGPPAVADARRRRWHNDNEP